MSEAQDKRDWDKAVREAEASKIKRGSEITEEVIQKLLELGTETNGTYLFRERLENMVVVPEEKWLHLKEDIEKGYLNLSKLKKGMINAKNEASKEEVGDFDIMLEFIEEVLLGFEALRKVMDE